MIKGFVLNSPSWFLRAALIATWTYLVINYPLMLIGLWLLAGLGWGFFTLYDERAYYFSNSGSWKGMLKTLGVIFLLWPVLSFLWVKRVLNLGHE